MDCCNGLSCFDTGGTCTNIDGAAYVGSAHFYCGASWCSAAYSCTHPCPGGSSDECPPGQYCYADVPCSEDRPDPPFVIAPNPEFNQYCGNSFEDASELCWQPCRNDGDCCAGQTCHSGVTACSYPDNIGSDHYFCGSDYCDTSYNCNERQPCPSGYDAQCPDGQRCITNTPCNANIVEASADFLRHGLPQKAMNLFRSYDPRANNGQATTSNGQPATGGGSKAGVIAGLLFAMCLIAGLVFWLWSKRRDAST